MSVVAPLDAPAEVATSSQPFSIVCLSPQPWKIDLPTNRQQIMLRAARRGHRVVFVETGAFLGRHLRALADPARRPSTRRQLFAGEEVAPGIEARAALNAIPWGHSRRPAAALNGALTAALVRRLGRRLPQPVVLWIYDPCAAWMAGACGEAFAVYDCVDDYAEQAGDDLRKHVFMDAADRIAGERSRLVFTTATPLLERHRAVNPRTSLVRNVGDYAHFSPAADAAYAAEEVADLRGPVLGFAGNFLPSKVDLALLEGVAAARPEATLLLVGPVRPGAERRLEHLASLPNVRWLGPKPYELVPQYVAAFDVALIPYVSNDYTRSCFPLKTFEYLAAGKPVVASGLPELAGMEPDVVLAHDLDSFLAAIDSALLARGERDRIRRMELSSANTWESRAGRLLALIEAELHELRAHRVSA